MKTTSTNNTPKPVIVPKSNAIASKKAASTPVSHKDITRADAAPDVPQLVAAAIGALMVGLIYRALPEKLSVGPNWVPLVATVVLLAPPLIIVFTTDHGPVHHLIRKFTLSLLVVLTAALVGSLALLIHNIVFISRGIDLLKPAVLLWSCNVLIFGIWFWEMDGNGPINRRRHQHIALDFQFPQQIGGKPEKGWFPGFIDYLFLAFCTSTALSPADTMPLTRRAKLMMMSEALISMLILVLLVSRSVNII
jgi:hypothetical protein